MAFILCKAIFGLLANADKPNISYTEEPVDALDSRETHEERDSQESRSAGEGVDHGAGV